MEGGCYCKEIRYSVDAEPSWTGACHCADCRKLSGAPYTVWVGYKHESFKPLAGVPEQFRSSERVLRSFCSSCHSPIAFVYTDPGVSIQDDLTYVAAGTLDDPSRLVLQQHIWVSQKLPWVEITDTLPQREK
jgi:hypothetical protein